ncbi:MAG TPA: tetratricopeptide repeat protein [Gemmatimonadales bacterium]|nr:tetratricopeptide repeat protein [Gemmatimonadales bacterium]
MSIASPRATLPLLLVLAGCGSSGGPEGAGDRAYAEGRYQEALASYAPLSESSPSPRLWSKVGATALHLGRLREATSAYQALASTAPDRAEEAAEGIEQVIVAAERKLDHEMLAEAVAALRSVAPDRPLGRHALSLMEVAEGPVTSSDFAAAVAVAPDARTVDSLLVRQATSLAGEGECTDAVGLYQAAIRRAGRGGNPTAEAGLVSCFFRLGAAQLVAAPDSAEMWFRGATGMDSTTAFGRSAMLGLGDARLRQGDLIGAALAYQSVLSSGDRADSLSVVAGAKLNALVSADPPSPGPAQSP